MAGSSADWQVEATSVGRKNRDGGFGRWVILFVPIHFINGTPPPRVYYDLRHAKPTIRNSRKPGSMIMVARWIKNLILRSVEKRGLAVVPHHDFTPFDFEVFRRAGRYSLTSRERLHALIQSVRYVIENDIEGAFVECGVYKGGSSMAMALTLLDAGADDRDIYLYDTYEGMPEPCENDVDHKGLKSAVQFAASRITDHSSTWTNCPLDKVQQAMESTGYPSHRVHYIKGLVEQTIPATLPDRIALLRLDTDFYESTKHELEHLYPNVSDQGIVIVDDYGHFVGARKAVDEYFQGEGFAPFLHRIDYTGRLIVKPAA